MDRVINVDCSRCMGCRQCEVSCSLVKAGVFQPGVARIRVAADHARGAFVPNLCRQCRRAPCAEACPVDALVRDPECGSVVVRKESCIGCRACVEACPFGCIWFPGDGDLPAKCDLCGGNPECVAACFQGALTFGSPRLAGTSASRRQGERSLRAIIARRREVGL